MTRAAGEDCPLRHNSSLPALLVGAHIAGDGDHRHRGMGMVKVMVKVMMMVMIITTVHLIVTSKTDVGLLCFNKWTD